MDSAFEPTGDAASAVFYLLPEDAEAANGDLAKSNGAPESNSELPPTHPRTNRLKLYYWYSRLALDAIALKFSHLGLEVLRPVYRDAYACCMAYLGLFVATMVPNGLFWGHNSAVVTPAYCAIFALKIVGLISISSGPTLTQNADKAKEEDLGIDIDAEYTFEMVEKLAKACEEAGNATPHRRAAAGSYAFFLFTVLAKAKSAWNAKLARKDGDGEESAVAKGRKRDREGNDAGGRQSKFARNGKASSRDREQQDRLDTNGNATSAEAAPVKVNSPAEDQIGGADSSAEVGTLVAQPGGVGGTTDSDHHFLRQLMQFQAGPSGVQTAIVHDSHPQEPHHQLYGFPSSTTLPRSPTRPRTRVCRRCSSTTCRPWPRPTLLRLPLALRRERLREQRVRLERRVRRREWISIGISGCWKGSWESRCLAI